MRTITEDAFFDEFNPIQNHIDENSSWEGTMFETYGAELEYVKSQPNDTVWTIIEGNNDDLFINSGFHFVNRIGYLISKVKCNEETFVLCDID